MDCEILYINSHRSELPLSVMERKGVTGQNCEDVDKCQADLGRKGKLQKKWRDKRGDKEGVEAMKR